MLKKIWQARANPWFMAPALWFEEQTGLKDIGRHYKMPGDLAPQVLEVMFPCNNKSSQEIALCIRALLLCGIGDPSDCDRDKMQNKLADLFLQLNPELESVRFDRALPWDKTYFCAGAYNGFNPDDIDYFIERDKQDPGKVFTEAEHRKLLHMRCKNIFGRSDLVQWVVSPRTADTINQQLDKIQNPKLADVAHLNL